MKVDQTYYDIAGNSFHVEEPRIDDDGCINYASRILIQNDWLNSHDLSFDDSDVEMMYHQAGTLSTVKQMMHFSVPHLKNTLHRLGHDYEEVHSKHEEMANLYIGQKLPYIDRWNYLAENIGTELRFKSTQGLQFSNKLAEDMYFDDAHVPVATEEPWRLHDLSYHPLGHLLLSGPVFQDFLYTLKDSANEDCKNVIRHNDSIWYKLEILSDGVSLSFLRDRFESTLDNIESFTSGSLNIVSEENKPYINRLINSDLVKKIETEVFTNLDTIKSAVKKIF